MRSIDGELAVGSGAAYAAELGGRVRFAVRFVRRDLSGMPGALERRPGGLCGRVRCGLLELETKGLAWFSWSGYNLTGNRSAAPLRSASGFGYDFCSSTSTSARIADTRTAATRTPSRSRVSWGRALVFGVSWASRRFGLGQTARGPTPGTGCVRCLREPAGTPHQSGGRPGPGRQFGEVPLFAQGAVEELVGLGERELRERDPQHGVAVHRDPQRDRVAERIGAGRLTGVDTGSEEVDEDQECFARRWPCG
jgi:hypothetical protein